MGTVLSQVSENKSKYFSFSTVTIQGHWLQIQERNSRKQDLLKSLAQKNLESQILK